MRQAQSGDRVTVQYIGTLENGRIFDRTDDDGPLIFTIGSDQVFPALEKKVIGMRVGETKNIFIPAADAYGPRRDDNILTLSRDIFPPDRTLEVGRKIAIELGGGSEIVMRVARVTDKQVTLDGNHPLAGLDLTFALRLDAIA